MLWQLSAGQLHTSSCRWQDKMAHCQDDTHRAVASASQHRKHLASHSHVCTIKASSKTLSLFSLLEDEAKLAFPSMVLDRGNAKQEKEGKNM